MQKTAQSKCCSPAVINPSCGATEFLSGGIPTFHSDSKYDRLQSCPGKPNMTNNTFKKTFCCGMTNYSVFASFFMLLFLYKITQSINQQLTSLHKAAWRRRTRRTEKMPSRKVKMEERRKHHHFLSLRHSSSPKIGTPSPAPVSIASLIHPSF